MIIGTASHEPAARDETIQAEALKARSEAAWADLYDQDHPRIFRYVLARTSDSHASEDIAAEVFLEALKGIKNYRPQGKPIIAWLYAIARNLVADYYKSREKKKTEPLTEVHEETLDGATTAALISGDPAAGVALLDVRAALGRVKDSHRDVIALHYYSGLTLPEVAAVLGKKERAVYSLHERAIDALAREMRHSGKQPGSLSASSGYR
jgi:RNA polymerase sigma-70 factor (ECF subfamily)